MSEFGRPWAVLAGLLAVIVPALRGAEFRALPGQDNVRLRFPADDSPRAGADGFSIAPLAGRLPADFAWALLTRRRAAWGDGAGASVENGLVFQSSFLDSGCAPPKLCAPNACNAVIFVWEEPVPNVGNLLVLANGTAVREVAPLPPGTEPPLNAIEISGLPAGIWTIRVTAPDGTHVEDTVRVLDMQPFADPRGTSCRGGDPPGCDLLVAIDHTGGLRPGQYGVSVDGSLVGFVPGTATEVIVADVAPGRHCASIVGLLETADGLYRGCFYESCCELSCADVPCAPPTDLLLCQSTYDEGTKNALRISWTNARGGYESIAGLVDGEVVTRFDGAITLAGVSGLSPGTHRIGLEADCGARGVAGTVEQVFAVRTSSPHPDPIEGELTCTFEEGENGPQTRLRWTNRAPSRFIDVFVVAGRDVFYLGTLPGEREAAIVTGTTPQETIVLQFFADAGGFCYGSPLLACAPETESRGRYLPGICNGRDELNLTSVVFLLNFLFLGGDRPPCRRACDSTGEGVIDLSDAIRVLNFLFLGGPSPAGWEDRKPVCVPIAAGDDCAVPAAACEN